MCIEKLNGKKLDTIHLVWNREAIAIVPVFEDYSHMLFEACTAMGLDVGKGNEECTIYPMMGNLSFNALATTCDGSKLIVYDRKLSALVGHTGALAIFAHELGHHYCGHLEEYRGGQEQELEADRFAGATLKRLRHGLEAVFSYETVMSDRPSHSHPEKKLRLAALADGWYNPDGAKECRK